MKYFVLGALASGMLLYGMSMIYGATGTLDLDRVAEATLARRATARCSCSASCSSCPASRSSWAWCPTTCGCRTCTTARPTPMTLLIGTAPKLAAFAFTLRVLAGALKGLEFDWQGMLIVLVAAVDGARQPDRDRADQPEADARVLDDREHGLHADGIPGRRPERLLGRDVLHGRLRAHEPRLVRHDPAPVARGVRGRPAGRLQGASTGARRGGRS